jgi:RNA polymerase sigma-70 factor (ECF subfamily)
MAAAIARGDRRDAGTIACLRASRQNGAMFETSHSLIDQLCGAADGASWQRLVDLYSPLLRGWIDRYGVQPADADDLIQDVLLVLLRELPSFRHNQQPGAFRCWLKGIVVNRLRNFWRSRGRGGMETGGVEMMSRLDELEDDRSELSRIWQQEHDRHLAAKLLEMIEPRFTLSTRQAFRRLVLDGADADTVAAELGLTLNAVFTAKSRVLRELRAIGTGLFD